MITFARLSEPGEREINEDFVGFVNIGPEIKLFLLADGLGGHGRGEDASCLVVEESGRTFCETYQEKESLRYCFENSQNALMEKQRVENAKSDLKSTLVSLMIRNDVIEWGHVGDSRLYYFKDGSIVGRTMDHSVPQMLVNAGDIKESEIRHHPDRNRLIRVMGIEWDSPKYQLSPRIPKETGQAFLMCSDGFWEFIEDQQMEQCLKKASDVYDWLERMEKIVVKNGKGTNMDNYSAIVVMIQ
ncbi:MAG: protein phosphatase 2C domain-containing protein [Clostridiales bacterium]|nr:protein phosphatase 2C domain-containing protein [Clostridiales bacterium]